MAPPSNLPDGFRSGHRLTAEEMTAIVRALRSHEWLRGDDYIHVRQGPSGYALHLDLPMLLPRLPKPDLGFWARITGHTADGPANRWVYGFQEVSKVSAGYGGWVDRPDGLSGNAYNTVEDINGATGVQGNGVDVANLDTADFTFAVQPAPTGIRVWMRRTQVGTIMEYWFQYENGVDGGCD